ncbi:hypothetical protein ACHAWO_005073 [Cyclotella atomus]|uniref:Cellulase n=1 Tax=Cyclotella atomus TaxID=382360 RepID=A0ABD3P5W9_9STRA
MLFKSAIAAIAAVPAAAQQPGCHPTWIRGGPYTAGSLVSSDQIVTTANGETTTTRTVTKNFKCISGSDFDPSLSHCFTYDPSDSLTAAAAWSDEGVCTGTAPAPASTSSPTLSIWSGVGCPDSWDEGATYKSGELAEVDGVVYKCTYNPFDNFWCGRANYKPGDSLYWTKVWIVKGSCRGTLSPTTSPVFETLAHVGGCPEEYAVDGVKYAEGDEVAIDGIVWQCREWPKSVWCNMKGYEPDGLYSKEAWILLGHCDGTIAPTSSPAFHLLEDYGGCPPAYEEGRGYEGGDEVSIPVRDAVSIVYQCSNDAHQSRWCSHFGPDNEYHLGWVLEGYCDGTISPTSSPVEYPDLKCRYYNSTRSIIIHQWNEKDLSTYTAGSRVRIREDIFKCRGYPYYMWCKMPAYKPLGESSYWKEAWERAGQCPDMFSPTVSPSISPTRHLLTEMPTPNPMKGAKPTNPFKPTVMHSNSPSTSSLPNAYPSVAPSNEHSLNPSSSPSDSQNPSSEPSSIPSASLGPTQLHSNSPSTSINPSTAPSYNPSLNPSSSPSDSQNPSPSSYCDVVVDPVDWGYPDSVQGWYDVSGCGVCNDYCRTVGNPPNTWISCKLAGSPIDNTESDYNWGTPGNVFSFTKCSGKGVSNPDTCTVVADPVDWGYPDSVQGWYDVSGCGVCNDYCRTVGNPPNTWISCKLAGSPIDNTESDYNWGTPGNVFSFTKCSGKGATSTS